MADQTKINAPAVNEAAQKLHDTMAARSPVFEALVVEPLAAGPFPAGDELSNAINDRGTALVEQKKQLDANADGTSSQLRDTATALPGQDRTNASGVRGAGSPDSPQGR